MKMDQIRPLSKKEINSLNRVLIKKLGPKDCVVSGTYENDIEAGKCYCHIDLYDSNAYKSVGTLQSIGIYVKKIIGVDEVYHLGLRIA